MSHTLLSVTNQVLARLREDQTSDTARDNQTILIREFVKQANSQVEDAWDWTQLRTTVQVTTVVNTYSYVLTDVGSSFKIFQVYNDTEDTTLKPASYKQMNIWLLENNRIDAEPQFYDVNGTSGSDPVINLYPVPDAVYNINFNLKSKQDLVTDDTLIIVPSLPIVLLATMLAVEERGTDGGLSLDVLSTTYQTALGDAIAYDAGNYPDETTWEVV